MTPELISRIVGLVRSQGDRVVLADSITGKAVVIMDLEQYEHLTAVSAPQGQQGILLDPAQTAPPTPAPAIRPSYAPAPALSVEPRVEAPFRAPELAPKREHLEAPVETLPQTPEEAPKMAKHSDNPFKKKAIQLGVHQTPEPPVVRDLTQAELLDKINRDIGDWKTAQERKRTDELTSVARRAPRIEPESVVEEEERFYLEPIE